MLIERGCEGHKHEQGGVDHNGWSGPERLEQGSGDHRSQRRAEKGNQAKRPK